MDEAEEHHQNLQKAIISAVCWVDRGYAKAQLEEYNPSEKEVKSNKKLAKKLLKGKDPNEMEIGEAKKQMEESLKADDNKMDEELSSEDETNVPIFTPELGSLKMREKGLDQGGSDEDEYMDYGGGDHPEELSDSEEEKDDFTIRKTDSLIVAATAEDDFSNLEVYLYDHSEQDLYVHHEIILGAMPLCLQWLKYWQGKKTNHIVVGTFLPEIEIWNLDSENVQPVATLGSLEKSEKYKGQINKYNDEDIGTHTEAVMCISLNPIQNEYLASGSEDNSVRIWDLDDLQCKARFANLHADKVQSVKWNNVNDQLLLSAGYDRKINILDVKTPEAAATTLIDESYSDIEMAAWHPFMEHNFAVCTEGGMILGYDTRKMTDPVFKVNAHQNAVSAISFSPHIPNMMASSSLDGTVKVWDIAANGGAKPQEIGTRHMKQGDLFSMNFCNDIPWLIASGGNKGEVAVWDCSENLDIENHFKSGLKKGTYDITDYNPDQVIMEEEEGDEYEDVSDSELKKKKKKDKKSKKIKS
jgi:periodic tryptophan protein 1